MTLKTERSIGSRGGTETRGEASTDLTDAEVMAFDVDTEDEEIDPIISLSLPVPFGQLGIKLNHIGAIFFHRREFVLSHSFGKCLSDGLSRPGNRNLILNKRG